VLLGGISFQILPINLAKLFFGTKQSDSKLDIGQTHGPADFALFPLLQEEGAQDLALFGGQMVHHQANHLTELRRIRAQLRGTLRRMGIGVMQGLGILPQTAPVFVNHVIANPAEECGYALGIANLVGPRRVQEPEQRFLDDVVYIRAGTAQMVGNLVAKFRGASTYGQAAEGFQSGFGNSLDLEQIEIDETGRLSRETVEQLRRDPPRLVIAVGTRAARVARERLPDLPILYCLALNPLENQLTGINIGGVVLDVELPRQFANIRKLLPNLRRIAVVYDELTSGSVVRQARQYLGSGLEIVPRNARTPQEAKQEIRDLFNNVLGPGDAFWLLWDSVAANPANFRTLVELSLKNKVPLIVPAKPFVEAGALISVGANYEEAGRQLARMAQRVLAGEARPGDFPAVAPAEVTVTINGEVARQIGVPIPGDLHADILSPSARARAP
jgi:putative tryptophan/tyrosine transport system substrate-binding protein